MARGPLGRIGCCYKFLGDTDEAMRYFKDALSSQKDLQNNKGRHKEILYQNASCKKELGDYEGALECYRIVFIEIGKFSTAFECVKRIEEKMGCKSGVIPAELEKESSSGIEKETEIGDMLDYMMSE